MNCEQIERSITLLVFGEATDSEAHQVRVHTESCTSCAAYLMQQQALKHVLEKRHDPSAVNPALLGSYRARLQDALDEEPALTETRVAAWWRKLLRPFTHAPQFAFAPGLVFAVVLVGFFSGWVSHSRIAQHSVSNEPPVAVSQGDTTLTLTNGSATLQPVSVYRVAAIQPASDGKVTVIYDGVERHTAEGSAQNPEIQRLLLNALQNPPNSGVRLDSIDALRAQVSDDDVRQTMLWVLQHDPNPGVRLKALESLRASVRDNASVREAMVHALMNDSFPGVRAQAIDALTQAPPQDASRLLQQVARTTANANVRLRCAYALKQMQAPVPRGILPPTLDEDEK